MPNERAWKTLGVVPEVRGAVLLAFWGGDVPHIERYNVIGRYLEIGVLEYGHQVSVEPVVVEDVDTADALCVVEIGPDGERRWIFQALAVFKMETSALEYGLECAASAERGRKLRAAKRAKADAHAPEA